MRSTDGTGVRETPYGAVERLVENAGCLYIYIGAMTAVIVPLESFGGADSYSEFQNRLQEKIRPAKAPNHSRETKSGCGR